MMSRLHTGAAQQAKECIEALQVVPRTVQNRKRGKYCILKKIPDLDFGDVADR